MHISANFEECALFRIEMCTFSTQTSTEMYHLAFDLSCYRCFSRDKSAHFKSQSAQLMYIFLECPADTNHYGYSLNLLIYSR